MLIGSSASFIFNFYYISRIGWSCCSTSSVFSIQRGGDTKISYLCYKSCSRGQDSARITYICGLAPPFDIGGTGTIWQADIPFTGLPIPSVYHLRATGCLTFIMLPTAIIQARVALGIYLYQDYIFAAVVINGSPPQPITYNGAELVIPVDRGLKAQLGASLGGA